jgi:hypothetical protein
MGYCVQGREFREHSNQQIIIGSCVLARPFERLDTVAVNRAHSEEHKKIRIDQDPGTTG